MADVTIQLTKKQLKALAAGIAIAVKTENGNVVVEPVADEAKSALQ